MGVLTSTYQRLGPAVLPEWRGRQKYMHTFDPAKPVMADGFEDYLDVVSKLCNAAGIKSAEAHMTVDEKIVQPGMSQRKPGAHLDGRFVPEKMSWDHGPGPGPGMWAHYCNNVPVDRMKIIVASSVPGTIVYEGEFEGEPQSDGNMEHIRDHLGDGELLPAHQGFLLSPDCIHESKIFPEATKRSFLRIAFAQ